MTDRKQPATRFRDEVGIVSTWVKVFAGVAFVAALVGITMMVGRGHNPPPPKLAPVLGLMAGTVIACYILLIGYINKDAGRRGMSRLLWTLVAMFVPNALGIVLYFILRKPRTTHCSQCGSAIDPEFSFCPQCRLRLQPVCPHCQKSVQLGDKFCPYCGEALVAAPAATPAASQMGGGT